MGVICGKNIKATKQECQSHKTYDTQNTLITFGCQRNQKINNIGSSIQQHKLDRQDSQNTLTKASNDIVIPDEEVIFHVCNHEIIQNKDNKIKNKIDSLNEISSQLSQDKVNKKPIVLRYSSKTKLFSFDLEEKQQQRNNYIVRYPMKQG